MTTNDVEKKTLLKAFKLFVNWAEECDFGYDNIPEEYEKYKEQIKDMGYCEGLMWIAYWEAKEITDESNIDV